MKTASGQEAREETVVIALKDARLRGDLRVPAGASGLVIFAHGSGSSRLSPRNRFVAECLFKKKIGSLLFDLLTEEEEARDALTGAFRFNIPFLTRRLTAATDWLTARLQAQKRELPLGYFGASTGAAAALMAAAAKPELIRAVVSRGGRPDLAAAALAKVRAPTLLIVGGNDTVVIKLNQDACRELRVEKDIHIVPHATHLFEEPGALEEVAAAASRWFERHFAKDDNGTREFRK
ncbi:MAG: dienelactone hydrolase family protein [Candidatus Omnitrophica bacterium]|nr:dienelactone hydrolase family protein [Candidatus Omnitrophota bacterium]